MKIKDEFKKFTHWSVGVLMAVDASAQWAIQHVSALASYLEPALMNKVTIGLLVVGFVIHYSRGDSHGPST
jgi:hypothetical protein